MILMPDTVIDQLNILGKHQQELLVFTYQKGGLIVDGDKDITGVDGDEDENQVPIKLKIKMISTIKRIKSSSIPIKKTKLFNNPSNSNWNPYKKTPPEQ